MPETSKMPAPEQAKPAEPEAEHYPAPIPGVGADILKQVNAHPDTNAPYSVEPHKIGDASEISQSVGEHLQNGTAGIEHLYRSYKHTPHAPSSMFLKYLVHRMNHQDAYQDHKQGDALDSAFMDLHKFGGAKEKNGHVDVSTLRHWIKKNPDLATHLKEHQEQLHQALRRGVGVNVKKINGEEHVALTRGLNSPVMANEHALSSHADVAATGFGSTMHHTWVPMKDLWYSYDLGHPYAKGTMGAENEFLASNKHQRYAAQKDDIRANCFKGSDGLITKAGPVDWSEHAHHFPDSTDEELAHLVNRAQEPHLGAMEHPNAGPKTYAATLKQAHALDGTHGDGKTPYLHSSFWGSQAMPGEEVIKQLRAHEVSPRQEYTNDDRVRHYEEALRNPNLSPKHVDEILNRAKSIPYNKGGYDPYDNMAAFAMNCPTSPKHRENIARLLDEVKNDHSGRFRHTEHALMKEGHGGDMVHDYLDKQITAGKLGQMQTDHVVNSGSWTPEHSEKVLKAIGDRSKPEWEAQGKDLLAMAPLTESRKRAIIDPKTGHEDDAFELAHNRHLTPEDQEHFADSLAAREPAAGRKLASRLLSSYVSEKMPPQALRKIAELLPPKFEGKKTEGWGDLLNYEGAPGHHVAAQLASMPQLPEDVATKLANSGSTEVIGHLGKNPRVPMNVFLRALPKDFVEQFPHVVGSPVPLTPKALFGAQDYLKQHPVAAAIFKAWRERRENATKPGHEDMSQHIIKPLPADAFAKALQDFLSWVQVETLKKGEELEKVSLTSESTATGMHPHTPTGYQAYHKVETYDAGNGLFHHVFHESPSDDGYASVMHTISGSAHPLNGLMASSAAGTNTPEQIGEFPQNSFANNPWKDRTPAIVHGETASHGPKGTGSLLYRQMLKTHGRMVSDSGTSVGANKVWEKLARDPEFKVSMGYGPGERHWAEYSGPKPVPLKVIHGDGRSLDEQLKEPENPYRAEISHYKLKAGTDFLESRIHHKTDGDVGFVGLHLDHANKRLYGAGPYWQNQGVAGGTHFSFNHSGAAGVARRAAEQTTGYKYAGDLPEELALPHVRKSENLGKKVLDPNAGYSVSHVFDDPDRLRVLAHHKGRIVGALHLDRLSPGAKQISAFQVEVDPAHRRRGVASAMYAHAEKLTGLPMKPSVTQSAEGRAFWNGNDSSHQFGKSESGRKLENQDLAFQMLGYGPQALRTFAAARFLVNGSELPLEAVRRAVCSTDGDLDAAALQAYGLKVTDENRQALKAVRELSGLTKAEEESKKLESVKAVFPDAKACAAEVMAASEAGDVHSVKLGGKHSAGSMVATDEESHNTWLLKPGTNQNSPAAGVAEEEASQSRREAAFYEVAQQWHISEVPETRLLSIAGKEVAAIKLLSPDYHSSEVMREGNSPQVQQAFNVFRESGELHRWAVLDLVAGNVDRHGSNILMNPEGEVALIDHGSAFAGPEFDPAGDKNSFTPFYLRSTYNGNFHSISGKERLSHMPRVNEEVEADLCTWIKSLDSHRLAATLQKYGIDPKASVARLEAVKSLESPVDLGINELWVTV